MWKWPFPICKSAVPIFSSNCSYSSKGLLLDYPRVLSNPFKKVWQEAFHIMPWQPKICKYGKEISYCSKTLCKALMEAILWGKSFKKLQVLQNDMFFFKVFTLALLMASNKWGKSKVGPKRRDLKLTFLHHITDLRARNYCFLETRRTSQLVFSPP